MIFLMLLFFFSIVQMPVALGSQLDKEKIIKNVLENFIQQDKQFDDFETVQKSINKFVSEYCTILENAKQKRIPIFPTCDISSLCENYKTGLSWSKNFNQNNSIFSVFNTEKIINDHNELKKEDINEIASEYLLNFFRIVIQNEKNDANDFKKHKIPLSLPNKTKEIFEKLNNNDNKKIIIKNHSETSSQCDDTKEEVVENTPPSRSQKKYFIFGVPVVLLCLYGIYRYTPLQKIFSYQKLKSFINTSKSKFHNMFDTYSNQTTKNKLIDQMDLLQKKEQDETSINDEENIDQEEIKKEDAEPQDDTQEDFQPIAQAPQSLGGKQQPFGSMRLLGSSFSATFLLLFAGYLLQDPNQGLKKIEKTSYDTYRTYLRYAVASVALVVSAVLVFSMTQTT